MPEENENIAQQPEGQPEEQTKKKGLFGNKEKKPKEPKEPKIKKEKKPKAPKEPKVKKEKKPKAPKPPKKAKPPKKPKPSPKGKKGKAAKEPKEKGGRSILSTIILLALLILALGGLGSSIYFDFFSVRTGLIDFLSSLDSENHTYAITLAAREEALTQAETDFAAQSASQEEDLQKREDQVKADESRLSKRAADLDAREEKLNQLEASTTPLFRGELSEEKLSELKNLGKIYSGMSAESAAEILPQLYGVADMASLLFYMDRNAAAAVLELLTPELSAQITTEMLRE